MLSSPQAPAQEPRATGGANSITLSTASIGLQSPSWRWEYLPSYRLLQFDVETYLIQVFGEYNFDIHLRGDNWVFWVPRALSDDERSTLLSRRYLRRFDRPRRESALQIPAFANTSIQHNHILGTISPVERLETPPASTNTSIEQNHIPRTISPVESLETPPASTNTSIEHNHIPRTVSPVERLGTPPDSTNTSIQHNHIPKTISPVERLGALSLERCRVCEIILISWFLLAVVCLATGLWRSSATGHEGKGFTYAAWVVAAGSVVLLAVQKIHDRRCKLHRPGGD
ncbi:hypothetical protein HYFRA_00010987 [Hymenoscyphus fraxineus]|uniref:Transmembrane protein n=1 Tax=Hymenoscyphus fraxineus TaxID=746836 RepID=A0A9N9KXG8_9HELO|nr:hypothetical protein HYFRA_00010987 [Hymenoscyphus fraxineus]